MADNETTEEDDAPKTGNVVDTKYRDKYGTDGHNGDDIARYLKDVCGDDKGKIDPDALDEVGNANGIDMAKYAHLNIGMQRMTLSNRLRGLHNRGDDVVIGDRTVKGDKEGAAKAAAKAKAKEDKEKAKEAKAKENKAKSSKKEKKAA